MSPEGPGFIGWASTEDAPYTCEVRVCRSKPSSTLPQSSLLPQPSSPTSPSPSAVSHSSPCYSPCQQHQPSWLSLSSSPLSNVISTPQRKRRQDNSPSPPSEDRDEIRLLSTPRLKLTQDNSPPSPSEDSDETRLPSTPLCTDSDRTTLCHSPAPSQQYQPQDFSPKLFDSPTVSSHDTTIDLSPPRCRHVSSPVLCSRRVLFLLSGDTTPDLSPRPFP